MKALQAISMLLIFSCAGCVKAPPRELPDLELSTPSGWTAAVTDASAPDCAGWLTFDDPHLTSLIELVLLENRDLQAAAARLDRAAAEARIAGADLKPGLAVGLDGSRQRQVYTGLPIPGSEGQALVAQSTRFGLALDVTWEADLWGRLRAGTKAALADYEAAGAELRGAQLSLAAQTAKLWFSIVEGGQQIELAQSSAESYRLLAEWVRSRYRIGVLPALDLRLAESNRAAAEAQLEQSRLLLDLAVRQLEILLGRYPDGSLLQEFPPSVLPPPPPAVSLGLPAELVGRRPDLVAAERRLAAADHRLLAARRARYPNLTLSAGGGTAGSEFSNLLDRDFGFWNLAARLSQPLFQGGRLKAGVELAGALSDEALAGYASAVLRAYAEVESLLASEGYLLNQHSHLAEATSHLIAAENLAESRYRSGVGDYLSVLNSQTRSFVSQASLLSLQRRQLENRIDLHLALGGGFAASPAKREQTGDDVIQAAAGGKS